jgi:hypothetical protein
MTILMTGFAEAQLLCAVGQKDPSGVRSPCKETVVGADRVLTDVVRFQGLHARFRSLIEELLELHESFDLTARTGAAFVTRLFAAWQGLKDPAHTATTHALWSALSGFEAEVALAESELYCLKFELSSAGIGSPNETDGDLTVVSTSCLAACDAL